MRDFMIILLECSVTMSALAFLYMIFTPLLAKRYSEKWRYYIWLVIIIGLIIPFRPSFGNAAFNVNIPSAPTAPIYEIENKENINSVDDFVINPIENSDYFAFPEHNGNYINSGENIPFPEKDILNSIETAKPLLNFSNLSWWQIAAAIWLFGVIASIIYRIIKHYLFVRTTKRWCNDIEDIQILDLFQSAKTEMKISKNVYLQLCPFVASPMLFGFIKPRIILPEVDFEQDELRFIFKHELVHYKRKDLWYKILIMFATAIHWFNPFVHFIAKTVDTSCERSCDAEVVKDTNIETRKYYSNTIINVDRHRLMLKTMFSTQLNNGKKDMKKRLSSVMDAGRKKGGIIIACIIVIGILGTGLLIAINSNKPIDDTPKQNIESPIYNESSTPSSNYLVQLPETDKLVLYRTVMNKWLLDSAINIFQQEYPDVEVEVRDFENDMQNYFTILETEIPAGKGPDLIFMMGSEFPDIYKIMDADIFYNLNNLINNDPDFNINDYNKIVLDSGIYKNKRYIMPLDYQTNMLFTTKEALAAAEMNIENLRTFDGFTGEIKKYLDKYASTKLIYDYQKQNYPMLFPWCGLQIIDYENKKVNIDGEELKKVLGAYKDIYKQDRELSIESKIVGAEDDTIKAFRAGEIIFRRHLTFAANFIFDYDVLSRDYSPIYLPFPSVNGKRTASVQKMAAILNVSPNKLNAYRFLKILLSEQIQAADISDVNFTDIPVLNSAVDIHVAKRIEFYNTFKEYEGIQISINEKTVKDYVDIATDIDDCQIFEGISVWQLFTYMEPYFKGEDSYENCLNKARNYLYLYISE